MRRGRRRGRTAPADPAIGRRIDLVIERLGSGGDGIGHLDRKSVYVPFTLPGDRINAHITARRGDGYAAEQIEALDLAERAEPACRHFGSCGGCRLQHMPAADYRDWKRDQIVRALSARGIEGVAVHPVIEGEPAARRRLRLAFETRKDGVILGFRRRAGREIVEIGECPIAMPAITALFPPLRRLLAGLAMAGKGGEVAITAGETGLDLLLETPIPPTLGDREALAAFAEVEDAARLAWRADARSDPEPIAARRDVRVRFGDVPVILPAGAFLQATEAAERAIVAAVGEAIEGAGRIADLFAGCGAISLALAGTGRRLLAIEHHADMVSALNAAARRAGIEGLLRAERRDLDAEPLAGAELRPIDALILDPPRAGARAQAEAIAQSPGPKKIAMVSCNPATFARDARILIDAGWRLAWVRPIDAFLYSAEIELVGAFERTITP